MPSSSFRWTLGRLGALALGGALFVPGADLTAQPQETRPDQPPHFAISGARIVTVSGQTIPRGTVVVDNGVIQAVGSDVQVPPEAWVVDGEGLTVYPGLIDAFSTLGHPSRRAAAQPRFAATGGGPPAEAGNGGDHSWGPEDRPGTFTWLSAADELDEGDERIASWRKAGFTSAVTTLEGGLVTGDATLINLAGERGREMVVKTPVAIRLNLQSREFSGYPGSLMGVFAYFKQLWMDARHYDQVWTAYRRDPRGKVRPEYDRALEPLRAVGERGTVLFPASGRTDVERAVSLSGGMGTTPVVYGVQRGYEAADVLREAGISALVNLEWPTAPRDADPEQDPDLFTLRVRDRAPTTPAELARAGVRFAFYTGGMRDAGEAHAAVKRALDLGLSQDAAVRALTLSTAEIFGVEDRLGSIERGKIANLLVTEGELFQPETKVKMVFVDGRRFEPLASPEPARTAEGDAREAEQGEQGEQGEEGEQGRGERRAGGRAPAPAGPPVPMSADRGPYREDRVTLIRNATVMTASRGTLRNTDVLVRDGKIVRIDSGIEAPSDATVVDATGMYVTPGIIDAHSHIAADAINEGSVAVSAMVGIKDVLDPEDVSIYRALAGGVTSINLLHGSANPIGGRNAVLKMRWGADAADLIFEGAPEGIKFALGENTKRDRNPDRYPGTRMGVQDVIRQAFLDAQAYMQAQEEYERRRAAGDRGAVPPREDLKLETLAEILRGERLVHAHSYRSDEILQLIRLAEEFGFRIATFQHVLEGYKVADEIAAHGAGASTFSDWWAYKVEAYDAIPYNAALMTERGVVVSINSDSGEEMRHLNQEAAKTMKWGGLSEEEALRLVTLNPARQLRVEDRVGSIDVGKDADLVIFQGHPLSMEGQVQKTYVDGKLYFDIELDRARQESMEAEKKQLLEKHAPSTGRPRVVTDSDRPIAAPRNDGGKKDGR